MYHWVLDPVERQAVMVNTATKCIHEDYAVIVEIACTNSSSELLAIKRTYHVLYKCSLEEDVATRTTGNLRSVRTLASTEYLYYVFHRPCCFELINLLRILVCFSFCLL
jgi:23S rRNA C2498 (ribose-2'-O)-methylase RlmM